MTRELLNQALYALKRPDTRETFYKDSRGDVSGPVIDAIDAYLAQPAPEPVAWIYEKEHLSFWTKVRQVAEHRQKTDGFTFDPVYTADQMHTHAAAQSAADNAVLRTENEALKLQARCWKSEAKAQKATVYESYQAVTGATGEPGDWNGANPVRAVVAERNRLRERIKVLEDALRGLVGAAAVPSADRWESALDAARAALGEP